MVTVEELERRIVSALECAFAAGDKDQWVTSRTYRTAKVKDTLGDLGHELGFQVCASGYKGAEEGEWLYDMSWYTLDPARGGVLTSQPMVLESEWTPDPGIDTDFQKLVQARTDVRVWVFAAANVKQVQDHVERCHDQALSFSGRQSGDRYVCAGFDWLTRTFVIRSFALP
jgi:hypothetical protein